MEAILFLEQLRRLAVALEQTVAEPATLADRAAVVDIIRVRAQRALRGKATQAGVGLMEVHIPAVAAAALEQMAPMRRMQLKAATVALDCKHLFLALQPITRAAVAEASATVELPERVV